MICLFETYLDGSVSSDQDNLNIKRLQFSKRSSTWERKRCNLCMCLLRILVSEIFAKLLLEKISNLETSINIISYVVSLYWPPSQTSAEFGSFITNLEIKSS